MNEQGHLLIVDDDERIRTMLSRYLEGEGFRVTCAADGENARQALQQGAVDLVLLDLGLPGQDGLSIARSLRAESDIGIIILTGKDDPFDRVAGLEVGADDYLAKPPHLREMLARIRSVMRRRHIAPAEPPVPVPKETDGCLNVGGLRLDRIRREVSGPDGEIALTTAEFNLLTVFMERPGRPLSRDQLMELTKGIDWTPFDRGIDAMVSRLRRKIEASNGPPRLIKTVRGVGYVFAAGT